MNLSRLYISILINVVLGLTLIGFGVGIYQLHSRISELKTVNSDLEATWVQCAEGLASTNEEVQTLRSRLQALEAQQSTEEAILKLQPRMRHDILVKTASAINQYSNEFGVDRDIAVAIAYHESRFNPHAISPVGARGTMQVMPFWRKDLDFLNSYRDLHDIDKNVRAGLYIYKQYLDEFDSNEVLALLAYNRGPGTVKYHIRNGRDPGNGYSVAVLRNKRKLEAETY